MAAKKSSDAKSIITLLLVFILVIAGAGYYGFLGTVNENSDEKKQEAAEGDATAATPPAPTAEQVQALLAPQADDIVEGQATAPVTIVEYASLSCPHCAHFYEKELPDIKKELIDTGKAKLVYRHFPHNEPGFRAAQLVNCADAKQRPAFIKALYDAQDNWAFSDDFLKKLKPIVSIGGIDSAAFDSCIANKDGENRILESRKQATEIGQIESVPSFFINGKLLKESPNLEHFRAAINAPVVETAKPVAPEAADKK